MMSRFLLAAIAACGFALPAAAGQMVATVPLGQTPQPGNIWEGWNPNPFGGSLVAHLDNSGNLTVNSCVGCGSGGGVNWPATFDVVLSNGTANPPGAAPGTAGFVLTSNGPSANPTFQANAAGGGITQLTGAVLAGPGTGSVAATVPGVAAIAHEFITAISTANIGTLAQPAFTDLSGSASAAQMATNLGAAVSTLCSASTTNFVRGDGTCVNPGGGGGVTWPANHTTVISNTTSSPNGAGPGIAGTVLTSNGASSDPTYQAVTVTPTITTEHSGTFSIAGTAQNVVTTSPWTAASTGTLPAASSVAGGKSINIYDNAQLVTNANTLTLLPTGSDTINLGASIVMNEAGQGFKCTSDGVSNWACFPSIPNGLAGQLAIGQSATTPFNWVTPSGDWSVNALGVTVNSKINGVAFSASPSTNTVPVVTGPNTTAYEKVPNAALSAFILPLAAGWVGGQNPNNGILATLTMAGTISTVTGRVEVAVGATATVTVWDAPSGTACSSATKQVSTSLNANTGAGSNQNISNGTVTVAAGDSLCYQTTGGSNWTSGSGVGTITVNFSPS